jgi:S1-C subfamily serine protease
MGSTSAKGTPMGRRFSKGPLIRAFVITTVLFVGATAADGAPSSGLTRDSVSATDAYRLVSPSVVVIEAQVANGVLQGSGVVVGEGQVVTNNHVVDGSTGFLLVHQGKRTWRAEIDRTDKANNLALLSVLLRRDEVFGLPVARSRRVGSLRIGERVYAVGAPQGLERTLSEGLVSGIQLDGADRMIQTTAAISRGSSGGGLFDSRGALVGVTTMYLKDGQNLNFAIPTDRIEALQKAPSASPGPYVLSSSVQPAAQSMPSGKRPDLPTPLAIVRAVIVVPSSEGPIAKDGGITAAWITDRATKALKAAGFGVFTSQDDAHKVNAYALMLTIDIDSMRISNTSFYPWTLRISLLDTSDFIDGTNGVVTTWESSEHGFGGSDVVVDQVAREVDQEIDKFAIAALKERGR